MQWVIGATAFAIGLLTASSPSMALTKNIKICFNGLANFSDSGQGSLSDGSKEYYWSNPSVTHQPIRGASATIKYGTATIWSGYLGDGLGSGDPGSGCTPVMAISSTFTTVNLDYFVRTYGYVNGNYVQSRDGDNGSATIETIGLVSYCNYILTCPDPDPPPISVNFTTTTGRSQAMWTAYTGASFAVYRHNGGNSLKTFKVEVFTTTSGHTEDGYTTSGNHYSRSQGSVHVSENGAGTKFILTHELGHRMGHLRGIIPGDCSFSSATDCPGVGGHSMSSVELGSCALSEGFAHFFATDVWNNHNSASPVVFQYYKNEFGNGTPTIDMYVSLLDKSLPQKTVNGALVPPFPKKYMETTCTATNPLTNRGVEVDWTRALWYMHAAGTTPSSFTAMMNWIHDAFVINFYTPREELDIEAGYIGGSLESNWNTASVKHGIDH